MPRSTLKRCAASHGLGPAQGVQGETAPAISLGLHRSPTCPRYKDARAGGGARALRGFLEQEGATFITTTFALRWAQKPVGVQRATWARRLSAVRGFARWLSAIDA